MAIGDINDITSRIKNQLPPTWFPGVAPVLNALLSGLASAHVLIYTLWAYAKLQTRILTATGAFLDLIAWDYLGPTFTRRTSETDASFKSRIIAFLLLQRCTYSGIKAMLLALTGRTPSIIMPCVGTGAWDAASAFAFDACGCWSGGAPLAIVAFRPPGQGIPVVNGFDGYNSGFDVGFSEWSDINQVTGQVTDAEITLRTSQWVAAGVNYTLNISS